ncbi:YceI family protein [Flavobacterium luminosum]|uniref:YceI family protein n=1 Tax=Flavobacterium luminosum TaxID=2949086 RepID=A0ABT0TNC7_9FLAO|nr:YceI family protein [Flavobacterium sp. HXWNR70]MCL9808982.1 YceI family protein [Flavobacterium sp. HXWNR70]
MKKCIAILVIGVLSLTVSCKKEKTDTQESTSMESSVTKDGLKYTVDTKTSLVKWSGSKPTRTHTGTINLKEGEVTVKDSMITSGSFFIDMNTITVTDLKPEEGKADLENHLKGTGDKNKDDFFNVTKYPTSDFRITKVEPREGKVQIFGNLSIKGVTKAINFAADVTINDKEVILKTEKMILNRTYFNVNFASKSLFADLKDKFINDEIEIEVEIRATR